MLTAPAPTTNGLPGVLPGTRLLGEVISWTCPGIAVRHVDVIAALREAGRVYFVPQAFAAFVDRVQQFLNRVNGRLARFPVPAGTPHGDRSVKDAVADGLASLIAEHRDAVARFGDDTRRDTLDRAAER